MSRRLTGRPVSVPTISPPIEGYQWAATVVPPGWCSVADVAGVLGLGRHQARQAIITSGVPRRMIRRAWYDAAARKAYAWKCLAVPADAIPLIMLSRLRRTLRRFGRPMPGRLRQRTWRARLACDSRQNLLRSRG